MGMGGAGVFTLLRSTRASSAPPSVSLEGREGSSRRLRLPPLHYGAMARPLDCGDGEYRLTGDVTRPLSKHCCRLAGRRREEAAAAVAWPPAAPDTRSVLLLLITPPPSQTFVRRKLRTSVTYTVSFYLTRFICFLELNGSRVSSPLPPPLRPDALPPIQQQQPGGSGRGDHRNRSHVNAAQHSTTQTQANLQAPSWA